MIANDDGCSKVINGCVNAKCKINRNRWWFPKNDEEWYDNVSAICNAVVRVRCYI